MQSKGSMKPDLGVLGRGFGQRGRHNHGLVPMTRGIANRQADPQDRRMVLQLGENLLDFRIRLPPNPEPQPTLSGFQAVHVLPWQLFHVLILTSTRDGKSHLRRNTQKSRFAWVEFSAAQLAVSPRSTSPPRLWDCPTRIYAELVRIVKVPLGNRGYDIQIGQGLLARLGYECKRMKLGRRCAIITDK